LSLELVQLIFTEIEKLSTLAADQFSDFIKDNYLPPLLSQTVNLKKDFNINEFSFDQDIAKIKSLKVSCLLFFFFFKSLGLVLGYVFLRHRAKLHQYKELGYFLGLISIQNEYEPTRF